jgi:hypothetical protein
MAGDKKQKQLKVVCPDDICLLEEQEVNRSAACMAAGPGAWLHVFCPECLCEITSSSQLP